MGKSGVFDSTFFSFLKALLFAEDVESKILCLLLRNWALIHMSLFRRLGFDSVVIMSLFRCCWAVWILQWIDTQGLIFIFFCPKAFLPTISAYTLRLVKLQRLAVTVASQELHETLLALPSLLWTQTILVKALNDCSWELHNFRVLYQYPVVFWHFSWLVF